MLNSCGTYKNRGKIETSKDLKLEKKNIEFQYAFFEANKHKMLGNYNDAGAYYLRCIELKPNSAAANYEFASILSMAKDYSHALKYSKKAYEIDEQNKWYQALLVSLYKYNGELKKSSQLLENMLEKHPDDYNSYLELTDIYLKMNQSKSALKTLDKFEEKYGFSEELMIEKNRIHIANSDYSSARLELQKLIKIDPDNIKNYLLLADLYLKEGKKEEALSIYQELLEKDSDGGAVHFSLSEYYNIIGDNEKSYDELKLAIAADDIDIELKVKLLFTYVRLPDATNNEKKQVYELVNILLEKYPNDMHVRSLYSDILVKDKQYEEARDQLLVIVEHTPSNYAVWEQLLFINNQLGDYESLYSHSIKMIEYFPNKAMAYFFAGLGAYQIEKYKSAISYLESGIDFAIDDTVLQAQFYTMLGDSYHRLKNNIKSDKAYESAIRLNPTNYYVHNNYSYYLSIRGEHLIRAAELMEICINNNPNNGTYLDTYAWVLYKNKNYKKALEIIKRAYKNGGAQSAVIVEHYGDILYRNNKKEEALMKWEEAKSIGKASEKLEQKIKEQKLLD